MFYIDDSGSAPRFLQGGVLPKDAREVSEEEWQEALAVETAKASEHLLPRNVKVDEGRK